MRISRHPGGTPDEKGAANPARFAAPDDQTAEKILHKPRPAAKGDATFADLRRALNCGGRTVERYRAAGVLPRPDLMIGLGTSHSPRWKAETIRAWIEGGCR